MVSGHITFQDGRERDEELDLPLDPAVLARYLGEPGDSLVVAIEGEYHVLICLNKSPLLDRDNLYLWDWKEINLPDPNLVRLYSAWTWYDIDRQRERDRWLLEL